MTAFTRRSSAHLFETTGAITRTRRRRSRKLLRTPAVVAVSIATLAVSAAVWLQRDRDLSWPARIRRDAVATALAIGLAWIVSDIATLMLLNEHLLTAIGIVP